MVSQINIRTLPDIVKTDANGDPVDQVVTYQNALTTQANAVAAYQTTLQQLRKLGLDDATYQKLLSEGTADQEFASQLLSGGKTAVTGLNKLDTQLQTVSKNLASQAGKKSLSGWCRCSSRSCEWSIV